MFKKLIYKFVYKERATPESYCSYLKNRCDYFGNNVYLGNPHKIWIDKNAEHFIQIGDNCQITSGVTILAHDESYSICGKVYNDLPRTQRMTHIGNNVFIGINSIILMGSFIGDNVIIGAGSVVSGNLESNSVYGGNPARRISSLDEYHEKHKKEFEKSAFLFIKQFEKRFKRLPKIEELHVYKLLFGAKIKTDLNKPNNMVEEINKTNIAKYKTVEDFLQQIKGNL